MRSDARSPHGRAGLDPLLQPCGGSEYRHAGTAPLSTSQLKHQLRSTCGAGLCAAWAVPVAIPSPASAKPPAINGGLPVNRWDCCAGCRISSLPSTRMSWS
jgi:hypothetical protein